MWWIPLLFLLILTPFSLGIDLSISHHFYDPNKAFYNPPFFQFLYQYGEYPAKITGIAALIIWAMTFLLPRWKPLRQPTWYLVLVMTIGPVFLVNVFLKDHWGRPRPLQTIEFGGEYPYSHYTTPHWQSAENSLKSMTSGHAISGFYFCTFYFLARRYGKKGLAYVSLVGGLAFGTLLGYARIAQGGHYFTDVLLSFIILWTVAYACDRFSIYHRATELNGKIY